MQQLRRLFLTFAIALCLALTPLYCADEDCPCDRGQFACTNCGQNISCDGHYGAYCGQLYGASCQYGGMCSLACMRWVIYTESLCQGEYYFLYDSLCCLIA
jgi:hypothetical protein